MESKTGLPLKYLPMGRRVMCLLIGTGEGRERSGTRTRGEDTDLGRFSSVHCLLVRPNKTAVL